MCLILAHFNDVFVFQGVIFNMSYHHKRNLLCSVSDDRSIRLWRLDLESTPRLQSDDAQKVLYGHSARVWDAKILDDTIVSVGEVSESQT